MTKTITELKYEMKVIKEMLTGATGEFTLKEQQLVEQLSKTSKRSKLCKKGNRNRKGKRLKR